MTPREALARLTAGDALDLAQMTHLMRQVVSGDVPTHLVAALLATLATRGERIVDILAATRAVREAFIPVPVPDPDAVVDLCGTGGDGSGTFNVSTAAAFVVSAAGAAVAKHGNRSASSRCGSADVLEALGVDINLEPAEIARCIREAGIGFMFTPRHHPAMLRLGPMRRELGVRTLFNVTGPLSNPAGARRQLVGVFRRELVRDLAEVLRLTGSRHVLVVHGEDGLDEISIGGKTHVAEMKDGEIREYEVAPEDFGLRRADLDVLRVSSVEESDAMVRDALSGRRGAARDVVALNAGAALHVSGKASSMAAGVDLALTAIDSGEALRKVDRLAGLTRRILSERARASCERPAALLGVPAHE